MATGGVAGTSGLVEAAGRTPEETAVDGLVEAWDHRGQAFGLPRLDAALTEAAPAGTEAIEGRVLAALAEYLAGEPLEDDATLLILARGR